MEAVPMAKSRAKRKRTPKHVLKLPNLEQSKSAVLNSLTSRSSQRTYDHAIREFIEWYCSEPRPAFNKTVVIRTIPVPDWVKAGIDAWTVVAGVTTGALLRSINKSGTVWGTGFSPKVIWGVVKQKAKACEIPALAPHDLRRTCARLCHQAGGELEQIRFLLGHVSV
jgi:hypothetical protein